MARLKYVKGSARDRREEVIHHNHGMSHHSAGIQARTMIMGSSVHSCVSLSSGTMQRSTRDAGSSNLTISGIRAPSNEMQNKTPMSTSESCWKLALMGATALNKATSTHVQVGKGLSPGFSGLGVSRAFPSKYLRCLG